MDLETVSHVCRTCGKESSLGKDIITNSAIRAWLDKTLNICLDENDGKSNFVCSNCSTKIRQWILFRTTYQKTRKNFELLAEQKLSGEDDKNSSGSPKVLKGKASRQQKRLDDWLKPKNSDAVEVKTEADEEAGTRHQKFAPLRVKIEPKIEADLHDTYGVTGINHYSPVKEEVKEEEVVDDEIVEDVDDDAEEREAKLKKDLAIKKRVETIRRKFQKIGERERKNKLIKTQKQALEEARKKTRETLPTKTARKAPQKPGPKSKQKPVDVSDEEPEKENQKDEPPPPRVTRKKVVNYASGKAESEDSDPDDPDEVDYNPENDEKSTTEENNLESDSEEEGAEIISKDDLPTETELQEPISEPMETESVPVSPKLPSPVLPKQVARRSRPMPLSKKKQEEAVAAPPSQKRKLDETEKEEAEDAPAKKKCLPLSIKLKLEEAERRKQKAAEVSISSASDSSDSESDSPTVKKTSLLDYFSKAAIKK